MAFRIPPGGFAGFAQMTPASRLALSPSLPNSSNGTRRKKKRKSSSGGLSPVRVKARRQAVKKKGGIRTLSKKQNRKLKFGSPAWRKKYMKK